MSLLASHRSCIDTHSIAGRAHPNADHSNPSTQGQRPRLSHLVGEFKSHNCDLSDDTRDLDRFYTSVRNRLDGAEDSDARLRVMLEVYETFFAEAMPDEVSRLGIVYTPVELVDFMLRVPHPRSALPAVHKARAVRG